MRTAGVCLEKIAGRTESTWATHCKAKTVDCVCRVTAFERHVEIAETVHLAAEREEPINADHVCDAQTDSRTDDVKSKNTAVPIALPEGLKTRKHCDRNIDTTAVKNVSYGCVRARCSAEATVGSVNYYLIGTRNRRTEGNEGKHRKW